MKTLIVYDSVYGNTEKIAQAIGEVITGEVRLARVGEVDVSELKALDLLVVGAPTHAARPSPAMREFLDKIQARALEGVKVAGFDTRLTNTWARIFGFAARGIANGLKKKGGTLVVSPEAFYVDGSEGPLSEGELERAAAWGKKIARRAE
ncbi:MAG TPA: flavodoxin family protein [Anaerolineae bacterium]|nr:flavodoxin family protein [Anaerolineae bacterium]